MKDNSLRTAAQTIENLPADAINGDEPSEPHNQRDQNPGQLDEDSPRSPIPLDKPDTNPNTDRSEEVDDLGALCT